MNRRTALTPRLRIPSLATEFWKPLTTSSLSQRRLYPTFLHRHLYFVRTSAAIRESPESRTFDAEFSRIGSSNARKSRIYATEAGRDDLAVVIRDIVANLLVKLSLKQLPQKLFTRGVDLILIPVYFGYNSHRRASANRSVLTSRVIYFGRRDERARAEGDTRGIRDRSCVSALYRSRVRTFSLESERVDRFLCRPIASYAVPVRPGKWKGGRGGRGESVFPRTTRFPRLEATSPLFLLCE